VFGRAASGFGWIDHSNFEHITVVASPGAEVERNFGGAGSAFLLKQDLVEKRPRPCFNFASGQSPQSPRGGTVLLNPTSVVTTCWTLLLIRYAARSSAIRGQDAVRMEESRLCRPARFPWR
jgi:hypothetical protein